MPGTDIIKASDARLYEHIQRGLVSQDADVDTLDEDKEKWKKGGTAKDHAVVRALEAHEHDRKLIDLHTVIRGAGRSYLDGQNDTRLPQIAVAPTHLESVSMRIYRDGDLRYWAGRFPNTWKLRLDFGKTWTDGNIDSFQRVAAVPPMPPDIRELVTGKGYLIMWEAFWRKNVRKAAGAPVLTDPALLEHISGSLYIVRAVWELTSLEAAALR